MRISAEKLICCLLGLESIFLKNHHSGFGMWSVPVVQSEQHVIYRLMAGGGREVQANMEETDGERLQCVEAQDS